MEKLLTVEVIVRDPGTLHRCIECEFIWRDLEDSYPTHEERALANFEPERAREFERVAHWVAELMERHPDQIHMRVIDAVSLEGVAKSKQFGIKYCPVVIVNHQSLYTTDTLAEANEVIDELLGQKERHLNPAN